MDYYEKNARHLYEQYDSLKVEEVHQSWLDLLPPIPGTLCDIGAGSGRDAKWFAHRGWRVTAVEPSTSLRELGQLNTINANSPDNITWVTGSLPELSAL